MKLPPRLDIVLALALAAAGELEVWLADISGPRWVSAPAAVLCALPLAWRRVAPLPVLVACTGVIAAEFMLGVDPNGPSVPLLIIVLAGYTLGERGTTRQALLGASFALASTWVVLLSQNPIDVTDFWFTAVITLAPIVLGRLLGASRRETAAATRRAARAEQERDQAVAEERSRIARELHDIVSHSISVMGIQAGAARRQLHPDQADARQAMLTIESTGREALGEMRRLLGVLRAGDGASGGLSPQPSLATLPELITGQPVDLQIDLGPDPLPSGIELAAYRIVQEALTNVRRHAGAAPATVTIRRNGTALELEIRDSGPGAPAEARPGHGIIGMQERAALYGGELETASPPEGGHLVRARLPIEATP
jgi:signal transduction histidine kinase